MFQVYCARETRSRGRKLHVCSVYDNVHTKGLSIQDKGGSTKEYRDLPDILHIADNRE